MNFQTHDGGRAAAGFKVEVRDYRDRIADMVAEAAADAERQMRAAALGGLSPALYLYYLPSTPEQDGRLAMVPQTADAPAGYQLAAPEPLRGNVPYAQFHSWIRERVQRLPILAHY